MTHWSLHAYATGNPLDLNGDWWSQCDHWDWMVGEGEVLVLMGYVRDAAGCLHLTNMLFGITQQNEGDHEAGEPTLPLLRDTHQDARAGT